MPTILRPLLALLVALGLGYAPSALALPDDSQQPIGIQADGAELDEPAGRAIYSGNVVVTQGSVIIKGDQVAVHFDADSQVTHIIADGQLAYFQQQTNAAGELVQAWGKTIRYQVDGDRLTLTEQAKLDQRGNSFSGHEIVYLIDEDRVKASAAADGSQRVTMTFSPKSN